MTGGLNNTGSGNDRGKPPLPLPYPAAWRGILYKIGAKAKEEYISTSPMSCGITGHSPPPHPAVSRGMAGSFGATRRVPTKKRGSPQRLIEVSLSILSPCVPARNIGGVPIGRGG